MGKTFIPNLYALHYYPTLILYLQDRVGDYFVVAPYSERDRGLLQLTEGQSITYLLAL